MVPFCFFSCPCRRSSCPSCKLRSFRCSIFIISLALLGVSPVIRWIFSPFILIEWKQQREWIVIQRHC
uniref:Uncharacterized protein n=1 Tax=Salix viminalis TaxID=40686 RepID=A0A6N2KN38_SALVM